MIYYAQNLIWLTGMKNDNNSLKEEIFFTNLTKVVGGIGYFCADTFSLHYVT